MPLQNRVDPFGGLFADPARGLLMGNRGGRLGPHPRLAKSGQQLTDSTLRGISLINYFFWRRGCLTTQSKDLAKGSFGALAYRQQHCLRFLS
jgi:hypothetical protein